ncbi:MAG: hypothetical protein ACFFCS_26905 [Candidatus Hodarchaeota archaeon]
MVIQQNKSWNVGQEAFVFIKGKIVKGTITKVNPKTVRMKIKGRAYIVSKPLLREQISDFQIDLARSNLHTSADLKRLLEETKEEYRQVFERLFSKEEMDKFNSVTISWNKQVTIRKGGHYKRADNSIMVSISFKNTPAYVIKHIMYHELLHIHFKKHGSVFRMHEKQFKLLDQAKKYMSDLFLKIRLDKSKNV